MKLWSGDAITTGKKHAGKVCSRRLGRRWLVSPPTLLRNKYSPFLAVLARREAKFDKTFSVSRWMSDHPQQSLGVVARSRPRAATLPSFSALLLVGGAPRRGESSLG